MPNIPKNPNTKTQTGYVPGSHPVAKGGDQNKPMPHPKGGYFGS